MRDGFDFSLMIRDSLADWRTQLERRFPRAPKRALGALAVLFFPFAARFALEMLRFHRRIGERGLAAASLALLRRYYAGVAFSSEIAEERLRERLAGKSVLVLANHPGVADALALFAVLETKLGITDFVVVANERDFFAAMPAVERRLISVPADAAGRASVLGRIEEALAAGRSVVLYPSGDITGDPCLAPWTYRYDELLGAWSPSVGLLIARSLRRSRREGGTSFAVLPLLCGGVLPRGIADARWMGRGRSRRDREAMAVGAVLAFRATRGHTVRVRAGTPIDPSADLAALGPRELGDAVYRRALATARGLAAEFGTGGSAALAGLDDDDTDRYLIGHDAEPRADETRTREEVGRTL